MGGGFWGPLGRKIRGGLAHRGWKVCGAGKGGGKGRGKLVLFQVAGGSEAVLFHGVVWRRVLALTGRYWRCKIALAWVGKGLQIGICCRTAKVQCCMVLWLHRSPFAGGAISHLHMHHNWFVGCRCMYYVKKVQHCTCRSVFS